MLESDCPTVTVATVTDSDAASGLTRNRTQHGMLVSEGDSASVRPGRDGLVDLNELQSATSAAPGASAASGAIAQRLARGSGLRFEQRPA